jgi:hypothetical protein
MIGTRSMIIQNKLDCFRSWHQSNLVDRSFCFQMIHHPAITDKNFLALVLDKLDNIHECISGRPKYYRS